MNGLKHTGPDSYSWIMPKPGRVNHFGPGFQSGVKKKMQTRFGGIFAQREQKS